MTFLDKHKVSDPDFIPAYRKHLAAGGAVQYFDNKSDADEAADRATDGLPPGMPGSGLYRIGSDLYEAHVEDYWPCHNGRYYHELSADEWRQYLSEREPSAQYIDHYSRHGRQGDVDWRHVIVKFRIRANT